MAITQENQPKSTCSISGQVVSAATGEPLRSARISLLEIDKKDPHTFRAVSDAEGGFALTGVAPGRYKFGARRGGYVPQSYKPPGGNPGALLELSAGTDLRDVLFRLSPAAVVVGRVIDENGEPASGVQVEALIEGKDDSLPSKNLVVPIKIGITNDLGE